MNSNLVAPLIGVYFKSTSANPFAAAHGWIIETLKICKENQCIMIPIIKYIFDQSHANPPGALYWLILEQMFFFQMHTLEFS